VQSRPRTPPSVLIVSAVIIQNTTFGGIQGFTQKPSTPWTTDDGKFAGVVHTERNWTYALVAGAGHLVPETQPAAAFVLAREFIFGSNSTGLVITNASGVAVSAGPTPTATLEGAAGDILRGGAPIYAGSGTTQTTVMPVSASVAAWNSFIATRWASGSSAGAKPTDTAMSTAAGSGGENGAASVGVYVASCWSILGATAVLFFLK
jgi:carboxypeptidase D